VVHQATTLERIAATDTASPPSWVGGLRRNDPATIRAIYAKHFPAVKQYVLQNSGATTDAQDVFQEAMTVLWLQVREQRLMPENDPGGFLFRVAKNKWLDVVRSAAHKHMKVVHDDRANEPHVETTDDVEERLARLRDVYGKLDDKCRTVLDRFYYERKDLATIAHELGVEEESIRTIKYRCMMKLRGFRRMIAGEDNIEAE
jgi:RNA polymerase sigma factor (sigma-70 family)